ncbi:MAG TPA: hypothetical protein VFH18_09320 [Erysipelotrichaceae bacterium]|nr:hypothetical protein [Erysipelotrichaceae bacterium]
MNKIMIKNGLYKLNEEGLKFLDSYKCQIAKNYNETKLQTRPIFFAMSSDLHKDILYMIPLTTIRSVEQEVRIKEYLSSSGFQQNFYEEVKILGEKRILKISSVFVVSTSMVNEWTINGIIYEVRNKITLNSIEKKLNIMINHYAANPNRSENHIIELRDNLFSIIKNK